MKFILEDEFSLLWEKVKTHNVKSEDLKEFIEKEIQARVEKIEDYHKLEYANELAPEK